MAIKITAADLRGPNIDREALARDYPDLMPEHPSVLVPLVGDAVAPVGPKPKQPRIAVDAEGLNKTERRFLEEILRPALDQGQLRDFWPFGTLKLKLPAGKCSLTPDFVLHRMTTWKLLFIDVKGGFVREDSSLKYKIVAEQHWHRADFAFVWRDKTGADGWAWRPIQRAGLGVVHYGPLFREEEP